MRWSESDSYFVNGSLKVFSVDLNSSEPLKLLPEENVEYDGPKGDNFKRLLFDNGFRVNRQGKVIIRVPRRNDEEEYNFFLLEKVVPLGPYGFTNLPSPTQGVEELKSLLEENRRLLEENRQEVKELKSLVEETRADLGKENAMLDELQRKNLDCNSEQLLLTLCAITESMNRVFVDFDLKPPAKNGDPVSVVGFLDKLRDLIRRKEFEFGASFIVTANEILASIAGTIYKSTGLSIGMETTRNSTPADLIRSLSTLREFMGNRFFIDGSVIVKNFHLMNEKDIPVIFRDSEAGVAELDRKEIGPKSLDNIDGKSIFYGYFNIPYVGKFKGILTRVDVTLPDEIMVKLRHHPNQLDEKRFWFVKANGEATFEKSVSPLESMTDIIKTGTIGCGSKGKASNLAENVIIDSNLVILGFLRRMNKTFVNKEGKYLRFDFTAIKVSGPPQIGDNSIRYYNEDWVTIDPFTKVQFDMNENPTTSLQGRVSLPKLLSDSWYADWNLSLHLGKNCAFVFNNFCFIGKITEVTSATFHNDALVNVFFEQSQVGQDCFVDALATTSFVLNSEHAKWWRNEKHVAPKIIDRS